MIEYFVEVPNTNIRESVATLDDAYPLCYDLAQEFGYAETLDLWGRHSGDYGDRPVALGQRVY